jgi:predicted CXXCH cytochrome family protein
VPHSSEVRNLLQEAPEKLCLECHDPAIHGVHPVTAPARDPWHNRTMACDSCHSPHGTANPRALWLTGDALCLRCHTELAPGG